MKESYRKFGQAMAQNFDIVEIRNFDGVNFITSIMEKMGFGDIVLVDADSSQVLDHLAAKAEDSLFDYISKKGAKTYVVEHLMDEDVAKRVLSRSADTIIRNNIQLIANSQRDVELVKQISSAIEVNYLDNIELCSLDVAKKIDSESLVELGINSSRTKILFAHQNHPVSNAALIELIDYLNANEEVAKKIQLIVSVHPYQPSPEDFITAIKQGESKLAISGFISGRQYKTTDLFGHIDGIVSVASTVQQLAQEVGILTYSPSHNEDFSTIMYSGFSNYVERLEKIDRNDRNIEITKRVGRVINDWSENLKNSRFKMSCPALLNLFIPNM